MLHSFPDFERRGSWSSDLVVCNGDGEEDEVFSAVSSMDVKEPQNVTTRSRRLVRVISEEDDDDDDDFDLSHLLEEEEEETSRSRPTPIPTPTPSTTTRVDSAGFPIHPPNNRQRVRQAMRMGSLMDCEEENEKGCCLDPLMQSALLHPPPLPPRQTLSSSSASWKQQKHPLSSESVPQLCPSSSLSDATSSNLPETTSSSIPSSLPPTNEDRDPPVPSPAAATVNEPTPAAPATILLPAVSPTLSAAISSSSSSSNSIESHLALYQDMVMRQQQPPNAIRNLMNSDPNLSQREVDAFWMGLKLLQSIAPKSFEKATSSSHDVPSNSPRNSNSNSNSNMANHAHNLSTRILNQLKQHQHQHQHQRHDSPSSGDDDDTKTAISAVSNMSCRELSILRLQRRMKTLNKANQELVSEEKKENNSKGEEEEELSKLLQELQEAQTRQRRLEQQLAQAGLCIAEDIPYQVAKNRVQEIAQQMQTLEYTSCEYYVLEQEMEKYVTALELTDEYLQEQADQEQEWEDVNYQLNQQALQQVLSHMPVDIRCKPLQDLLDTPAPCGKPVPKPFLLKFQRTNILGMLRMNPTFLEKAHVRYLESFRYQGLTLTERRALHAFLLPISQKWQKQPAKLEWFQMLRQNFKEHLLRAGGADNNLDYTLFHYGYPNDLQDYQYEPTTTPATTTTTTSRIETPMREAAPTKPTSSTTTATTATKSPSPCRPKPARGLLAEIAASSDKMKQKVKQKAAKNQFLAELESKSSKRI